MERFGDGFLQMIMIGAKRKENVSMSMIYSAYCIVVWQSSQINTCHPTGRDFRLKSSKGLAKLLFAERSKLELRFWFTTDGTFSGVCGMGYPRGL
jgi:hypothetical protein